jgi:endonuclease/exonuclease/phosphatase family metal-dependent hydrolase
VLLLESDLGMARSANVNVAREIASRLGYDYVYGNSYLCLSSGNAREAVATRANTTSLSGNAILSRLPLRRAENFSVAITKDKFETREKRLGHKKALWAEMMIGETPLAVAAVHLDSGASSAQRAAQLADVVAKLRARGVLGRSLVGGDFNTTTYDAESVFALLENLALKLWRGGFPHAIEHYLHPQRLYEKRIFDVLTEAGYDFEHYNALGVGTLRYRVGDPGCEGRVRDFLPQPFVEVLRRKLAPYGGAVGLKLDWFAGQGVTPTRAGTVHLERASALGVSDHDPIWVEIGL